MRKVLLGGEMNMGKLQEEVKDLLKKLDKENFQIGDEWHSGAQEYRQFPDAIYIEEILKKASVESLKDQFVRQLLNEISNPNSFWWKRVSERVLSTGSREGWVDPYKDIYRISDSANKALLS